MPSDNATLQPWRTVLAALVGGTIGALALGFATGQIIASIADDASGGLVALAGATLAAGAGTFLGGAAALVVAFRDEPVRARVVTAATTVVLGPVLAVALALGGDQVAPSLVRPPILPLAVAVVLSAIAGRWLAVRRG